MGLELAESDAQYRSLNPDFVKNKSFLSTRSIEDNKTTAKLKLVLRSAETMIGDRLTVNPDFDIGAVLLAYGKTNGYELNSELSLTDLSAAFNFKYDLTYGSILSVPDTDEHLTRTVTTKSAEEVEYDTSLSFTHQKSFDGYNGEGSGSLAAGEIISGYTIHARIISLDTDSNSRTCNVTYQFGVSKTDDMTNIM
jgi:hypothetical protein